MADIRGSRELVMTRLSTFDIYLFHLNWFDSVLLSVEGETSTLECAHELGKLCENRNLVVNLIPYNQTDVKDKLRCPSLEHIKEFQRIVGSYGTFCTIRRTMGADIDSACGQLVVLSKDKDQGKSPENAEVVDIEESSGKKTEKIAVPKKTSQSAVKVEKEIVVSGGDDSTASVNELEKLIRPLQIATIISASCFLVSSIVYMKQKRR